MPLTVPAGLLTKANFVLAYLKPLVDATETNADTALTTAQAANTLAGQKYTKPASGIPSTDLAASVQAALGTNRAGLRYTFLYNGTSYIGPDGVAATTENSTASARTAAGYSGTYRDYVGGATGPDANTLGLMIDGDAWDGVA